MPEFNTRLQSVRNEPQASRPVRTRTASTKAPLPPKYQGPAPRNPKSSAEIKQIPINLLFSELGSEVCRIAL
jgi:hypothetical protein